MKVRDGFVSNSSSCSFVCKLCGHEKTGWDWDAPTSYGFIVCKRGHVMCSDHLPSGLETSYDNNQECEVISSEDCPLCLDNTTKEGTWLVHNIISSDHCTHLINGENVCDILSNECDISNCPMRASRLD